MSSSSLNIPKVDQEQIGNLVKFHIKSQQSCFIFGSKGTGKSDIIMQVAKECGYKLNYINLSVIERSDLCGFPNLQSSGDTIQFKSPYFLPKLTDGKPDTILLFDEVDKVSHEITAPLLEILLYKTINGQPLNIVSCILTGNLPEERAFSNQMSSALLDRGAKYILDFNFECWMTWAKEHGIHDLIIGFLQSNPEYCLGKTIDDSFASPSPRGWSLASVAIDKAKKLKMDDIDSITHMVSGYVGNDAGLRFRHWFEYYRKFEPFIHSLIERGYSNINFEDLIPTERLIFVITACHYTKQKTFADKGKSNFLYLDNLCKFFENYKVEPEVKLLGINNSFSFQDVAKYKLYSCKAFFELFSKLNENIKNN